MIDVSTEQFVMPFFNRTRSWIRHPLCLGYIGGAMTGTANVAWPAANRAIFIPFRLTQRMIIESIYLINGTLNGNVDVGIYNADGTKLTSTGSIAQTPASNIQLFDFANVTIGPGLYFLGVASNSATGQYKVLTGATFMRSSGVFQMASAFPLPATATFAVIASDYAPQFYMLFGGGALDQTYISESTVGFPMMPHIHPWSLEAVTALTILSSGGGALSAAVSTVWPIANISIFYPFALCERTRLRSLWCRNGATVSGNIDMGIYTGELNRKIVSSGSVAQAGINSYQTAAIDVTLGPGVYQFAIACSNTTATFFGTTVTGAEFSASDGSISSMTANFPLGAALSMSSPQIFIPLAGVSRYTIV